jgi:outer membrane receptor protein involved in Fe transport
MIPDQPFFLTVNSFGDTGLKQESIDAFEIAYTGVIGGRTTIGLAVYQNDTDDSINFTFLTPNQEFPQGLGGSRPRSSTGSTTT